MFVYVLKIEFCIINLNDKIMSLIQKQKTSITFILSLLFFFISLTQDDAILHKLLVSLSLLCCLLAFRFYSRGVEKGEMK